MFALSLRQIYRISDKVVIRTLRNRRLSPKGPNPGLDNRIQSFEAEGFRVKEGNPEEFLEQSESDFSNVGEVYNEHLNETMMGKYELRHRIVKEKYFKENMPNLLTWSEKEQIRHLAATEPDEWTPERIAASFPVTVPVVKRLLKYPWKPSTEQRIARHDANVMRNWKELKDGSLNIPDELRQQFLKFSNRTIPPLKKESIKVELKPEEDLGEFESIVRKCAAKEETRQSSNEENSVALSITDTNPEDDMKRIKGGKIDPKRVTLEELTTKIKKRLEKGRNIDVGDQIILSSVKPGGNVKDLKISQDFSKEIELHNETNDPNSIVPFKDKDVTPKDVMNYPERIRIPKKAYKKGATYKVNDCFYDHDGKFLYRVLGMSN
ncbi:uncharacterized protein LOC142979010 [Anticarsia gemmatalis]|uniref:uncharacterized protein LOC142979010 n=1 Tax=Anticarsia gemmatalis TaxID=129554 RepID=UPI003F75C015